MNYKSLLEQNETFISILKKNSDLMNVLDYLEEIDLPNFYIAAGSIYQTIWNYYDEKPLNQGIKDIDIVYYDEHNLTRESEDELENKIITHFKKENVKYEFDIHNEARIHIWKKPNENPLINHYENSEDSIRQWLATVQAVGITKKGDKISVFAPYGLSDIFSKTIRPIKNGYNSKEDYTKKAQKWPKRFEGLTIINW